MKKKIFISSTYIDLIPHRQAIWELLQSFNVEIIGMEKFGARSETPLEVCLKGVRESDILISIIGMRYGSIESSSGKSFSQLEYEEAVKYNRLVYIYLIDETKAQVTASHIDFSNYSKLAEFKLILKHKHTVDTFCSETDLVRKLNMKLRETLEEDVLIKNYRPRSIEAIIQDVSLKDENWIVVVGLKFGLPHEVYACKRYDLLLPDWVKEGKIILEKGTRDRYDFQFDDYQGYKVTIEGLSRVNFYVVTKIFNKLLEKEISVKTAIEVISEIDLDFNDLELAVKEAIVRILSRHMEY